MNSKKVNLNEILINDESQIYEDKNIFLNELIEKIIFKKKTHNLAAQYYEKKSRYIVIPTIVITSISGIGSFLSTSNIFNDQQKLIISISVGVFGSLASLLQTCQSNLKFDTKAEMFRNAAEQYENLLTKINFEKINPNEKDFINKLEKKILEIQNNCKYFPPSSILNKFSK